MYLEKLIYRIIIFNSQSDEGIKLKFYSQEIKYFQVLDELSIREYNLLEIHYIGLRGILTLEESQSLIELLGLGE